MGTKRLWITGLLLLLLLLPTSAAFAGGPVLQMGEGGIFVDEDVVLEAGETYRGDLGIFSGDLTLPETSSVVGDVFVVNGDALIEGRVEGALGVVGGDLTVTETGVVTGDLFGMGGDAKMNGLAGSGLSVLFGDLELGSTAVVAGDLLVSPGDLDQAGGAQVQGEQISELPFPELADLQERFSQVPLPALPETPELPERPLPPARPSKDWTFGRVVGTALGGLFLSVLLVGAGMLVALIWPRAATQVTECISALPAQSFGLGLLTFILAAILEVVAVVAMVVVILVGALMIGTVILIPVGLLLIVLSPLVLLTVPVAMAGAFVLGWVSVAQLIGTRVLGRLRSMQVRPLSAVLVGLLITVPLSVGLWLLQPGCCGLPFVILLTSIGLGAVFHTRFGTRDCMATPPPAPIQPHEQDLHPMEAMDEEVGQPDLPPPA